MTDFDCLRDCPDIGHCCREFALTHAGDTVGYNQPYLLTKDLNKIMEYRGWPFLAKRYDGVLECWLFHCPELGSNGLCTRYETRPSVCRSFKPGSCKRLCCVRPTLAEQLKRFMIFLFKLTTFSR
ncbi:MAG: YkgJ family cysteine cluster protein [bacterium]